jgi:hypothetical protein
MGLESEFKKYIYSKRIVNWEYVFKIDAYSKWIW